MTATLLSSPESDLELGSAAQSEAGPRSDNPSRSDPRWCTELEDVVWIVLILGIYNCVAGVGTFIWWTTIDCYWIRALLDLYLGGIMSPLLALNLWFAATVLRQTHRVRYGCGNWMEGLLVGTTLILALVSPVLLVINMLPCE